MGEIRFSEQNIRKRTFALTFKLVDWALYRFRCYPRRSSTPQSETESGECSDDGELSDLTPCNPSPSLSQLLSWSGCTAGEIAADFCTIPVTEQLLHGGRNQKGVKRKEKN